MLTSLLGKGTPPDPGSGLYWRLPSLPSSTEGLGERAPPSPSCLCPRDHGFLQGRLSLLTLAPVPRHFREATVSRGWDWPQGLLGTLGLGQPPHVPSRWSSESSTGEAETAVARGVPRASEWPRPGCSGPRGRSGAVRRGGLQPLFPHLHNGVVMPALQRVRDHKSNNHCLRRACKVPGAKCHCCDAVYSHYLT